MARFLQIASLLGVVFLLGIGTFGSPNSSRDIQQSREKRNAVIDNYKRWPDGVVPVVVAGGFSQQAYQVIQEAINEFHQISCLKFVSYFNFERPPRDFLVIQPTLDPGKCVSNSVGRLGGQQMIELGSNCIQKGTIIHELMHAIGFFHEQSRLDRDKHVYVLEGNINPNLIHNFNKEPGRTWGFQYDFCSIMHYPEKGFSINGGDTIVSKNPYMEKCRGDRVQLTQKDIMKINRLYECRRQPVPDGNPQTLPQRPLQPQVITVDRRPIRPINPQIKGPLIIRPGTKVVPRPGEIADHYVQEGLNILEGLVNRIPGLLS